MAISFKRLINELLIRDSESKLCNHYASVSNMLTEPQNFHELCLVLKSEFPIYCQYNILDGELINRLKSDFNQVGIYYNVSVNNGYVLISKETSEENVLEIGGEAIVVVKDYAQVHITGRVSATAYDNSTIRVYDNATLIAYNNAQVFAFGNALIKAHDNSQIKAHSHSFIESYDNTFVRAYGGAQVKANGNSKVISMGQAVVHGYGDVSVIAQGQSYISSFEKIDCNLKEKAIYYELDSNTLYYADKNMQIKHIKEINL